MRSYPPYQITHVELSSPLSQAPPFAPAGRGHYLVFWWQDLALGHAFVEPGPPLTSEAYSAALTAAIAPAVAHYAAEQPTPELDPRLGLERNSEPPGLPDWLRDWPRWHRGLAVALAPWLAPAIPPQVPVSVIVCTRDRPEQLRRCLQQLLALPCAPTEIVVVDNAPADERTCQVAQAFSAATYRREPRPGLDVARNTGIAAARCPVVTFVDDDVVVHPLLLYHVWQTFKEPATAAMTGLVIALELETEAQLVFEQFWSFNRGYVDKRYGPAYLRAAANAAPPVWDIGAGANMSFRRSVFEEVGLFDERLDVGAAGCSGDSEMWYRILRQGHQIHYNPRAIAYHEHRRDLAGLQRQLFAYMRGHVAAALIQQEQHPEAGYARYLTGQLPAYYLRLIRQGFPRFRFRSQTLWSELKGLVSGVAFYYRTRNRPAKPQPLPPL